MELRPVYLLRMGLGVWWLRDGAAQEALPEWHLGEGLALTLLDEALHDLILRRHGAQDVLARRLATGLFRMVAAM